LCFEDIGLDPDNIIEIIVILNAGGALPTFGATSRLYFVGFRPDGKTRQVAIASQDDEGFVENREGRGRG
jgi:hypothetical protein